MNKTLKNILIAAGCVLAVFGAAYLIITLITRGGAKSTVSVYHVQDFAVTDYWGDMSQTSGYVRADKVQSEYLSETQKIKTIEVTEGQEVHTGDLIATYDTTLTELELKKAEVSLQKLKLNKQAAEQQLRVINSLRPYTPPSYTPVPTPVTPSPSNPPIVQITPYLYSGTGTQEDPYVYMWGQENVFDNAFVISLAETLPAKVYCEFAVCEGNALNGDLLNYWGLCFDIQEDGSYTFTYFPTDIPEFAETEEEEDYYDYEPVIIEPTNTYTSAEIAKMRTDKQTEIRDLDVKIRLAEVNLERMKQEAEGGNLYAKLDGVVRTAVSVEEAEKLGTMEPMIVITGGGGYYIDGAVSELELDTLEIGQEVQVNSWETGEMLTGEVVEISDIPTSMIGYSGGNPNVTYYGFTVFVSADANLREDQYVDMQFSRADSRHSLYVMNAFILNEEGTKYVFVRNEEGRLEKRKIETGRTIWGEYSEIRSGLTVDDYMAFPYGNAVKDGAKTKDGDIQELYGY